MIPIFIHRKKNVPKSHAIEELLCYSTHLLVLKLLEKYSSVPSKYIYFLAGKRTIICVCFLIFSFLKGSLLHNFVLSCLTSTMSIKMKGIYKSFKYISKIFGTASLFLSLCLCMFICYSLRLFYFMVLIIWS